MNCYIIILNIWIDPNYAKKYPDDISLLKVFKVEDKQSESEDSSTTGKTIINLIISRANHKFSIYLECSVYLILKLSFVVHESNKIIEDCRSDIQMKAVLRRIHRDLKQEFRAFTSFNLNRLYREKKYFISCLDEYSKVIFGKNPTQREIVLLGKKTYLYSKLYFLLNCESSFQ